MIGSGTGEWSIPQEHSFKRCSTLAVLKPSELIA